MNAINKVLVNKNTSCKPIWFMRQAGRHLPEFRKIRKLNPNFIKLCLNPVLSSEITMQPVKRYDVDAAIIFSDILVIPYALGQKINFTSEGPKLSQFNELSFLKSTDKKFLSILKPTYETIKITRKKLNKKKSLIAFVGAPWTLLVYMFGLKSKKNKIDQKKIKNKKLIKKILDKLSHYICVHITKQIKAGADVVQVFDSWASLVPKKELYNYCFEPNLKIVKYCKKKKIPIICFPRGLKKDGYYQFAKFVKPDGLNLDTNIKPSWAKKNLSNLTLQGGLNPKILLKSNKKMLDEVKKYLDVFNDVSYIFNLGHGVRPETNPKKVKSLIKFVRNYK